MKLCFEQLYSNNFDNLEGMSKFLKKKKPLSLVKLREEYMKKLEYSGIQKETEFQLPALCWINP